MAWMEAKRPKNNRTDRYFHNWIKRPDYGYRVKDIDFLVNWSSSCMHVLCEWLRAFRPSKLSSTELPHDQREIKLEWTKLSNSV